MSVTINRSDSRYIVKDMVTRCVMEHDRYLGVDTVCLSVNQLNI